MDKTETIAVIELSGKQFLVKKGDQITADKLDLKIGDTLNVTKVLLIHNDKGTQIGQPYLEKASVDLVLESEGKAEKIRVFKYKAKSRYRKTMGHRQSESNLVVKAINL